MEAFRLCIERVMKKGSARRSYAQLPFRILSQLAEQHREDEGPCIVVGAITFGKIRNAENGVLEDTR